MKEITVNSDRTLTLSVEMNGIEVIVQDGGGGIEYSYIIPDKDIVMLLNYWKNWIFIVQKALTEIVSAFYSGYKRRINGEVKSGKDGWFYE